jgi:hypothetical protein
MCVPELFRLAAGYVDRILRGDASASPDQIRAGDHRQDAGS